MSELLKEILKLKAQRDKLRRQLREMKASRDHWRMRCLGKVPER